MKNILMVAITILLWFILTGQVNIKETTKNDSVDKSLISLEKWLEKNKDLGIPGSIKPGSTGTTGKLEYIVGNAKKESLGTAIYNDYLWSIQHNKWVYEWQGFSTKVIFFSVVFLVFLGMAFSGIQFYKSYKTADPDQKPDTATELELSLKGVKVTSSILGVIILVISLAFFYLYLVHVYPINLPD